MRERRESSEESEQSHNIVCEALEISRLTAIRIGNFGDAAES
jgi:hypothetical protein